MSHFVCLVILPEGATLENAEEEAGKLLEPFDGSGCPDGRWDYWSVGSRWDGWIFGPEREQACHDGKHGFNFGTEHQQVSNNCRPVSEIPLDDMHYVPFAMLTPDGEWHEIGRMCWFGQVANPMDEDAWLRRFREVMTKYAGHLAIATDLHA